MWGRQQPPGVVAFEVAADARADPAEDADVEIEDAIEAVTSGGRFVIDDVDVDASAATFSGGLA